MQDEFNKPRLRAIQYFYIDGTFEFTFGGLCLILGAFFFIQAAMPESVFSRLLMLAIVLIVPGGILLKNRLVASIKEKVTYPRTGYVSYPKLHGKDKTTRNRINLGMRAIVGSLNENIDQTISITQDWVPAMTAFFFAFMLSWLGFRSGLRRFLLLGMLVFTAGILFSFIHIGNLSGLSMFYTTSGVMILISGILTLMKYLRENPQPEEVDNAS